MSTLTASPRGLTRREFLHYIWGASIALAVAETGGALLWAVTPQYDPRRFAVEEMPEPDGPPKSYSIDLPEGVSTLLRPQTRVYIGQTISVWVIHVGPMGALKRPFHEKQPQGMAQGISIFLNRCTHLGCITKW